MPETEDLKTSAPGPRHRRILLAKRPFPAGPAAEKEAPQLVRCQRKPKQNISKFGGRAGDLPVGSAGKHAQSVFRSKLKAYWNSIHFITLITIAIRMLSPRVSTQESRGQRKPIG